MTLNRSRKAKEAHLTRPTKNVRRGEFQHATQAGNTMVHRSDPDGRPVCGWFVRGIVYTSEPVNCEKCREI